MIVGTSHVTTFTQLWDGVSGPVDTETFSLVRGAVFDGTHLRVFGTHPIYGEGIHCWDLDLALGNFVNYRGTIALPFDVVQAPSFDGTYIWWHYDEDAPTHPNEVARIHCLSYNSLYSAPVEYFSLPELDELPVSATRQLEGTFFDGTHLRVGVRDSSSGPHRLYTLDPTTGANIYGGFEADFGAYEMKGIQARYLGGGLFTHIRGTGSFAYGSISSRIEGPWEDSVLWVHPDGGVYRRGAFEIDGTGLSTYDARNIPLSTQFVEITGTVSTTFSINTPTTDGRERFVGMVFYNNATDGGGGLVRFQWGFNVATIPFGEALLIGPTGEYVL